MTRYGTFDGNAFDDDTFDTDVFELHHSDHLKGTPMRNPTNPTEIPPQDKNRDIEKYINRGQPAPQPDLNRDMSSAIERESNKRRNG